MNHGGDKTKNHPNSSSSSSADAACAACKHQRRKCGPHCLLAPYFPAEKQRDFLDVHKLYGVNKVIKMLKKAHQRDQPCVMNSVVFHAKQRAIDPVGGCYRVVKELENAIRYYEAELVHVYGQIAVCRAQMRRAHDFINVYDKILPGVNQSFVLYDKEVISHGHQQELDQDPMISRGFECLVLSNREDKILPGLKQSLVLSNKEVISYGDRQEHDQDPTISRSFHGINEYSHSSSTMTINQSLELSNKEGISYEDPQELEQDPTISRSFRGINEYSHSRSTMTMKPGLSSPSSSLILAGIHSESRKREKASDI